MKINLIVRPTAGGVHARSAQCPGLAIERTSVAELMSDLKDILAFYFYRPRPFDVLGHEENARAIDGTDVVLRCATDEHYRARTIIALGWVASQLDDSGEPAVIAASAGEGLIWTNVVSYGDPDGSKMRQPSETAADLPDGPDTTVGQMMLAAPLLRASGLSYAHT